MLNFISSRQKKSRNNRPTSIKMVTKFLLPWVPEVFSLLRRGGSSAAGRPTYFWPSAEDTSGELNDDVILLMRPGSCRVSNRGTFLRLDRNRTGIQGTFLTLIYLEEVSC